MSSQWEIYGGSSLETGEVTPLQPKESSPSLPWITLQCGCRCVNSASAQVEGLDYWFHWFHCHQYRGGRKARIVQGKSWLMEIWTDEGTQGRGLLEEEDPKEGVSTYWCPRAAARLCQTDQGPACSRSYLLVCWWGPSRPWFHFALFPWNTGPEILILFHCIWQPLVCPSQVKR